jgi:hypothetical protein
MACRSSSTLTVIFETGKNADEVMTWPTHWLFYDGNQMEIENKLVGVRRGC